MQTTNTRIVRADFVTVIRGISPSYALYQDVRWAPVDELEDVPGDRLRLFFVRMGFSEPMGDGIYGDGIEYETNVEVWTNYSDIPDHELDSLITEDGRQLWLALEARLDPTLAGLVSVQYAGFQAENEQPGQVWGQHQLVVRYLGGSV